MSNSNLLGPNGKKIFTPRQMRNETRKMGQKVKNEMRSNLMYLIKPRPRWIPMKIWVWMLKRFLSLPEKNNNEKND